MKKQDGIYERKCGKYKYLGYLWTGFPADGLWWVQNGQSNMSCLIGSKEKVPIFALNYRLHEEQICNLIRVMFSGGGVSMSDISRACCDYFAKLAEAKNAENI